MMKKGVKRAASRLAAGLMALMMCFSMTVSQSLVTAAYAETEPDSVSTELKAADTAKMADSVNKVVKAVDELKKAASSPAEASAFDSAAELFNGFINICGKVGTVTGAINGSVTFLKLIGVMKDSNAEAMSNISEQLTAINEKLGNMDAKLDKISSQMAKIEAKGDFNNRGVNANLMISAWKTFSTHYMETQMDECMRRYDAMLRDGMKDWTEYTSSSSRQIYDNNVITNKIVLHYVIIDPHEYWWVGRNFHGYFRNEQTLMNYVKPDESKPASRPDPYTLYKEDIDLFNHAYLIFDESFLPKQGEIGWNINTYQEDIRSYILDELKKWRDDPERNADAVQWTTGISGCYFTSFTDDQLEQIADDCVNAIIYRVAAVKINESADFATTVSKQFGEYCEHLTSPKEGIDAMLQALFLTNAFEFETKDDIRTFCNQMSLKTGVYAMFAMNILGMSRSITDDEKQKAASSMCDALDKISTSLERSITGQDAYCYVTNSVLRYGDVTFTGKVSVDYSTRGAYASYYKYKDASIDKKYNADQVDNSTSLVGDTEALVISYFVRQAGEKMDHDYLTDHFTLNYSPQKYSAMVTSLDGQQTMETDGALLMNVHNVVGEYFTEGSNIRLNALPGSAKAKYLEYRSVMKGSIVDGATSALTVNKPLFGQAVYGETAFYWVKDESAILTGPVDDPSYSDEITNVRTGSSFIADQYYTKTSESKVSYNALYSIPYQKIYDSPLKPDPIGDYSELNVLIKTRSALSDLVESAEKTIKKGGWTAESVQELKYAIAVANKFIAYEKADLEDLQSAEEQLKSAIDGLKALKKQSLKVAVSRKIVKSSALRKSGRTVKVMTVKNAKGKVTYKLSKVNKARFKKYFKVNKSTGKITLKKGLKKGKYILTVKVSAAGNKTYAPAAKTVKVTIAVTA